MKRLSISLPAIALVLALAFSGAAFTSAPGKTDNKIAASPARHYQNVPFLKPEFQLSYYWFWYPDDTFNDYETASMEIYEMNEFYYPGVEIDTNPMGGTQIMNGYPCSNYPHNTFPSIYLYAHFTY